MTTFDAYYREHYERVLRFVRRRIADPETAKEVCAECFVTAWRKFDPAAPFSVTWLYQTARHHLGNAYQKRDRDQQLLALLREQVGLDLSAREVAIVAEALAELSEPDREALRLTYWERLTAAEVGQVLGCSERAAWKRVSRARIAVRDVMQRRARVSDGSVSP